MTRPHFGISIRDMARSFWNNRTLILTLTRREIAGRYRGSLLGSLWSLFNPLLMLAVYTFVFSVVFSARWGNANSSRAEFALFLFVGLLVFNVFAECVNRSPTMILANTNYVNKVIFPLEIMPWICLGTSMFNMLISMLVWLLFYISVFGLPTLLFILVPFALLPLLVLILGLSWLLLSLGIFIRDISQVVPILTSMLMFLSPIFYPVSALPPQYQQWLFINPLTVIIESLRDLMIRGVHPDWTLLLLYGVASLMVAWCGFAWFQKTRKGFADVL